MKPLRLPFLVLLASSGVSAYAQPVGQPPDVLLQGFYWNTHPGDHWQNNNGLWWDSLGTVAEHLVGSGFQTVWIPSPAKGQGGRFSMGYDLYDYYDLGTYDQKFTRRTRFGTDIELQAMLDEFDRVGLRTMMDAVLNHRDGADAQSGVACGSGTRFNVFNPASGRFPADALAFHPNPTHCDNFAPYHDNIFGQDVCYFHQTNSVFDPGAPGNGWYHGPHALGAVGDSLVAWGRWLHQQVGFDEFRVDAVKHIEPGFLAPWLVELAQGDQPFAVGEYFGSTSEIIAYHNEVEQFVSTYGTGSRDASLALFDFGLRFALKGMADGGGFYDMRALNSEGLHFNGMDPFDVVTFVENHDFDRIGFVAANCGEPGAIPSGSSCVKLSQDSGHDPVLSRKHLAYAYLMAAEGRPTVWWKDYYWYGLGEEIRWLMALRRQTAQGESAPMSLLNPSPEIPQADLWALRRWGTGSPRYGAVVVINDNGNTELGGWLDTPHSSYELRDYSDAFLFTSTEAFADGRAFVRAGGSNYAWYAPTGLYPRPLDEPDSAFDLTAEPGGKLHYVALRASDAASFLVNGAPIQPGDEVAILGPDGATAAGLGRVGQRFQWTGQHDVIIEILGNADGTNGGNRLKDGDALRLVVHDASANATVEAANLTWAASGSSFTFNPDRPASRGGAFSIDATDSDGAYTIGGISRVTSFEAGSGGGVPVAVTLTPMNPPVVIPRTGGSFGYTLDYQNLTGTTQSFTSWTDALLPNGAVYGPVLSPVTVTLAPGATLTQTLNQAVPRSAPAGTYTYRAHAGPSFGNPFATDSFTLTKSNTPAREGAPVTAWLATDAEGRPLLEGDVWTADALEAAATIEALPVALRLDGVYPNPFRDGATVRFTAPGDTPVRLELYDGLGRRVRVLYEGTPTGQAQSLRLNGSDLPSGVYLVRLVTDSGTVTQRVLRMR